MWIKNCAYSVVLDGDCVKIRSFESSFFFSSKSFTKSLTYSVSLLLPGIHTVLFLFFLNDVLLLAVWVKVSLLMVFPQWLLVTVS